VIEKSEEQSMGKKKAPEEEENLKNLPQVVTR
jgi:hypothetical protein